MHGCQYCSYGVPKDQRTILTRNVNNTGFKRLPQLIQAVIGNVATCIA